MNSNPIKVVVVEDEPLISDKLIEGINEHELLEVCGKAESVNTAFQSILNLKPDAIFLDIKIIGGDGFALLDRLRQVNYSIPPVILNTGHEEFEFAQTAFNDYRDVIVHILKKPFFENWEEKLQTCIDRILAKIKAPDEPLTLHNDDPIRIRSGNESHLIKPSQVLYLEVNGSGTVVVVTKDLKSIIANQTMTALLSKLPKHIFQISRFNAVNLDSIEKIDHNHPPRVILQQGTPLKIGETYLPKLLRMFDP